MKYKGTSTVKEHIAL